MRLGYVTRYSEEEVRFARQAGFDCLELSVRMGTELDPVRVSEGKIEEVKRVLAENGIKVASLLSDANHLHPDPERRREANEHFIRAMDLCKRLGTDVLAGNAGGDRTKTLEENISVFGEVFNRYTEVAEEKGVRIALENCPHASRDWPISMGNIALSPVAWEMMFEAVPSPNIGLEYDPSHLVWLGIDYIQAIYDFGERIFIVHAKDTEILPDALDVEGIYGHEWWRYRIPGWGGIDWRDLFSALWEVGFQGDVVIEHEDPVFAGERRKEGLRLGFEYLKQFVF